jgi:hypothetical protein
MADLSEHRNEQPERTDRKPTAQGQHTSPPRLLRVQHYNHESQVRHRKSFDAGKAVAEARHYIGRPYPFAHLFFFVLDWLTFKRFDLRSHTRRRQTMFCSQLVSRAYVKGGVDLCKLHADAGTSPADLISEGRIEPIHAFSKHDPLLAAPEPTADANRTEKPHA